MNYLILRVYGEFLHLLSEIHHAECEVRLLRGYAVGTSERQAKIGKSDALPIFCALLPAKPEVLAAKGLPAFRSVRKTGVK